MVAAGSAAVAGPDDVVGEQGVTTVAGLDDVEGEQGATAAVEVAVVLGRHCDDDDGGGCHCQSSGP